MYFISILTMCCSGVGWGWGAAVGVGVGGGGGIKNIISSLCVNNTHASERVTAADISERLHNITTTNKTTQERILSDFLPKCKIAYNKVSK